MGKPGPLRRLPGLHQGPWPSLTASPSSGDPLGLRLPCLSGVFKPARGRSAGRDWLPAWGCPSFSRSSPAFPPTPPGCLGPGTVAPSVSNLALCVLSAPSSGLWLSWGPRPWCLPFILPDPYRTRSGREASLCLHPAPTSGAVCRGRGLCHPTRTGRESCCPFSDLLYLGVFGELSASVSGIQPLHPLPWPRSARGRERGVGWGLPLGSGLQRGGVLGSASWGTPSCVCNWGNTATPLEASPYWTPMWASSTPMELPLVCPPSARLPARTPPRFGAPSPARPLAAPPIGPASGPAPRLSSLGLGLSRVLAARRAPGGPRDGQQRARPEGPGPDLQAEIRGVSASASGSPSAPRPGVPWGLSPSLPPSRPPWRGVPLRSPPPALLSGQSSHPPGTAPARFCLASAPPPPTRHSEPFRSVAGTWENSGPLCSAGSPPPPGPQPVLLPHLPGAEPGSGQPSANPGAL